MNVLLRLKKAIAILRHYYIKPNPSNFGYFGKGAQFARPADLKKA